MFRCIRLVFNEAQLVRTHLTMLVGLTVIQFVLESQKKLLRFQGN